MCLNREPHPSRRGDNSEFLKSKTVDSPPQVRDVAHGPLVFVSYPLLRLKVFQTLLHVTWQYKSYSENEL